MVADALGETVGKAARPRCTQCGVRSARRGRRMCRLCARVLRCRKRAWRKRKEQEWWEAQAAARVAAVRVVQEQRVALGLGVSRAHAPRVPIGAEGAVEV